MEPVGLANTRISTGYAQKNFRSLAQNFPGTVTVNVPSIPGTKEHSYKAPYIMLCTSGTLFQNFIMLCTSGTLFQSSINVYVQVEEARLGSIGHCTFHFVQRSKGVLNDRSRFPTLDDETECSMQ